jgi:hypothetical protein
MKKIDWSVVGGVVVVMVFVALLIWMVSFSSASRDKWNDWKATCYEKGYEDVETHIFAGKSNVFCITWPVYGKEGKIEFLLVEE